MQNLVIYIIASIFFGSLISIFFSLSKSKKGEDFTFDEFKASIKLKNIDFKYIIVYFIVICILGYNLTLKDLVICLPLSFALLLAFILDYMYMIIPDTASITIASLAIIQNIVYFSKENVISSLLGGIVGAIFFLIINIICRKIIKKDGFGLGDVKLLGALGIFFGLKSILVIIVLSITFSAIVSIPFLIIKCIKKSKEDYIAFAPFIVISSFIVYIISADTIINLYLSLIDKIIT